MLVSHDKPPSLRARSLARVCAGALFIAAVTVAFPALAATFNPLNVISYETWRASSSMSTADVQAFLQTQAGPLKSLVTTDYVTPGGTSGHGVPWKKGEPKKSAAQIICDAAQYWNINPRVILATLQKEQSLLTLSNSSNASRLIKAMGMGIYSGSKNRYPGFGNQVFNGARVFSTYEVTYHWVPLMPKQVTAYKSVMATKTVNSTVVTYTATVPYTKTIKPVNASTFALYTYTPYYPQKNFWTIYVRYFGDPQSPPRLRPVYRFRNRSNGTYYYTASEAKRYTLIRTAAKKWAYEGVSFTCDTSATANTVPLYQMYDTRTHKYLYTVSATQRAALLKVRPKQWRVDTITCCVVTETSGTAPVYKLQSKKTHAVLLISSASLKKSLTTGRSAGFKYLGIAFRLDSLVTTSTPVGPSP